MPCPALLWESAEFLGDKDLFLCFNGELSSRLAAASRAAWKVVTDRTGHMEFADMALASPRFLKAIGIIKLGARDMERFQAFQSRMVLSFLQTHLRKGQAGGASMWSPPGELQSERWGAVLEGEGLKEHAAGAMWTPKQRAAVKSVLQAKARLRLRVCRSTRAVSGGDRSASVYCFARVTATPPLLTGEEGGVPPAQQREGGRAEA